MKIKVILILLAICFGGLGCYQKYYNVSTGREEIYFYSTEKEVRVGDSLSLQVEKMFKPYEDPLVQLKINEIGQKLAEVCDRKEVKYHFKVLDKDEVNAFALPGGYVYFFLEIWKDLENDEDQIAAVLAHEIAHINARHSIKRLQSHIGYGALSILIAGSPNTESASRQKAIAGIGQLLLAYSQSEELEADILAVRYMKNAGFDPNKIIDVLKYLQQKQREKPIRYMPVSTHPYISERIRAVKEQISGGIGFDDYINTLK